MFLEVLRRRNPKFIEAVIGLHQHKKLPANTYVIDLDAVEENARIIRTAADPLGLKVFAMTKQMGRNPSFSRAVMRGGIDKAVAVDMACARACYDAGLEIGHLGHLVQVPVAEVKEAASLRPDYWTVFNKEKATQAAAAAAEFDREQPLLARIFASQDQFYRGHEGGFAAEDIVRVADAFDRMASARFAGITSFPALLFDAKTQKVKRTHNLRTLQSAARALAEAGRTEIEINTPGTTSSTVLAALREAGATQCEPGHGLTGTTPLHAVEDLPEKPAVLYLSEVSHFYGSDAFCFGGGLYIDPVFPEYDVKALVTSEPGVAAEYLHDVEIPPPSAIDYYGMIDIAERKPPEVGATVIFGFRAQAFVTRANIVGVRGIASGQADVEGVYDIFGNPVSWFESAA